MWIYSKRLGFFSVTDEPGDPDTIRVRARAREDLERLIDVAYPEDVWAERPEIETSPWRDYPFRIYVTSIEWKNHLGSVLLWEENYTGFKGTLPEEDKWREELYHRVWAETARGFDHLRPQQPTTVIGASMTLRRRLSDLVIELGHVISNWGWRLWG